MAKKKKAVRRKKQAAASIGLSPAETQTGTSAADAMAPLVERDGGAVLAAYRDPFGGKPVLIVALPIDRVEPTPFQRDPSDPHVKRLMTVIETLDRFLDPIIVVRHDNQYWTPNGNHRLQAMRRLGAKAVVALLIPEADVAYQILALNTEKAHNLRERALEVIKMYEELAAVDGATEETYGLEFEEAALITLGLCYLENGRFSGGAYHPILRRSDEFIKKPLSNALEIRRRRAKALIDLDQTVVSKVETLKSRGLTSPYLKSFVVARINPIRFRPKDAAPLGFDEVIERMTKAAEKMNVEKIKIEDLAKSGGAPEE